MESSSPKLLKKNKIEADLIFDPIRKQWVKKTKEEIIRQNLIKSMVEIYGFPPSLLAVEKELSTLPHLQFVSSKEIPKRRVDIIVFSPKNLTPLLVVECKAEPITKKFLNQIVGYNHFIKAPYLVVANADQILLGTLDKSTHLFHFEERFISFAELYF